MMPSGQQVWIWSGEAEKRSGSPIFIRITLLEALAA
jgi:hypothetical protein